jgi:hypothetical protein
VSEAIDEPNARTLAGQQLCLFGNEAHHCGRPAAVHVLVGDGYPTLSCAEHVAWFAEHDCEDVHPVMSLCGMPGCTWMYATVNTPGHCVIEGLAAGLEAAVTVGGGE